MPNNLTPILAKAKTLSDYPTSDNVTHSHEIHNRLCGDSLWFDLEINTNRIQNISIKAEACSLCKASATTLIDSLVNSDIKDAQPIIKKAQETITALFDKEQTQPEKTGNPLVILQDLEGYQTRKRCVTLPWEGITAALNKITQKTPRKAS